TIRALPDGVGPHGAAVDSGADDADAVVEPGAVEPGDDQLTGGGEFAVGELIPPGPVERPIRRRTGDVQIETERISGIGVGVLDLVDDPIEINPTATILRGRTIDMLKGWAD